LPANGFSGQTFHNDKNIVVTVRPRLVSSLRTEKYGRFQAASEGPLKGIDENRVVSPHASENSTFISVWDKEPMLSISHDCRATEALSGVSSRFLICVTRQQ
jgi:hypothetical protein